MNKYGWAWIDGKQRTIWSLRLIKKGLHKNKYEAILTTGNKKKIIKEEEILCLPENVKM